MLTLDGLQQIDERGFKEAVPVRELLARKTVQLFISEFFQGNYTIFDCPTLNDGTPLPGGRKGR
ncbi:hypothetical protein FACS189490_07980 [Clostridia bacterium]|nr:hypothetical protein FACS189490_07980 [Clostridia bacterium]